MFHGFHKKRLKSSERGDSLNNAQSLGKALRWESFMAFRYLVSKKSDHFVSVITTFSFIGICIGVATLIIVMSVMSGFKEELLYKIVGMNGHIIAYGTSSNIPDDNNILHKAASPNIKAICQMIERQGIVSSQEQSRGATILAMTKETFAKHELLFNALSFEKTKAAPMKTKAAPMSHSAHEKSVEKEAANGPHDAHEKSEKEAADLLKMEAFDGNSVIIGERLAQLLFVDVGDTVTIMNPQGETTPFGTVPTQQEFTVVGLFNVGLTEYDKNMLLMPLSTAQEFFNLQDKVTQVIFFVNDVGRAGATAQLINQKAECDGIHAVVWQQADSQLFRAIQVESNVMFIILTLIILVASFNVVSGLVMLVKDKTKDIAIMKTIGATDASIMRIFIITGSTIGIAGTILGTILGTLASHNLNWFLSVIQKLFDKQLFNPEVYFLYQLPTRISLAEIALIDGVAIGLSLIAALYPSLRAARLDPAQALRTC
ncbi:MAG: ABC transporter permease [Holosporales bacterium]|jgi:lipoprotein-releasing system permease protein|nr:ABC transporter permease [Holosporales bacterium]